MDNHSSKLPERCNPSNQSSKTPSRPSKRSLMSEVWARSEHPSLTFIMLILSFIFLKGAIHI